MLGQATKSRVIALPSGGRLATLRGQLTGRIGMLAGFAAIYIFWGSSNLAIHYAIETVPPFLMAATRFLIAGAVLYGWARMRGAERPRRVHWRTAFITGGLMLLGGSAIVGWAQQYLASGMASLLVATVPLWAVVVDSVARRQRPGRAVTAGLGLGLVGIGLLVGPRGFASGDSAAPLAMLVLLAACLSWALGTHYSRKSPQPASASLSNGLNLIAGGFLLVLFSGVNGEFGRFVLAEVSLRSVLGMGYLVIFGSVIGFSAYMHLVKTTTPARASSNFYVNPVIGVFLGWLVLGEPIGAMTFVAAAVIIAAVVLIVSQKKAAGAVKEDAVAVAAQVSQVEVAAEPAVTVSGPAEIDTDPAAAAEAAEEPCWHPLC
jgi:drug/metabolite transporter (DMT)-like permease